MSSSALVTASSTSNWDATHIQSLQGQVAIVTGANSGIGYEIALELARKGAHVVLACRNESRGKAAQLKIYGALLDSKLKVVEGAGTVEFMKLDVSEPSSVKAFVKAFRKKHHQLHLLINNAGIMAAPYAQTVDGFELQMATNHLGHFVLTAELFDLLQTSTPSRIVNVSSMAHRHVLSFTGEELITPKSKYNPITEYARTKLVNILFTAELARRLEANEIQGVTAVVAHPGFTASNVYTAPSEQGPWYYRWFWTIARLFPVYQSSSMGALPILYAATAPQVKNGEYYGPNGFMRIWGHPVLETPSKLATSVTAAQNVWEQSEQLTHTSFSIKKQT